MKYSNSKYNKFNDITNNIIELNNPKYSLLNTEDYQKHAHILAVCDGD